MKKIFLSVPAIATYVLLIPIIAAIILSYAGAFDRSAYLWSTPRTVHHNVLDYTK